jgi:hypothetical protein
MIVVIAGSLAACGGRVLTLADGAELAPDAGSPKADLVHPTPHIPDARQIKPDQAVPAAGDCVIAIRVDNCCQQPMPVFAQQLKNDPCLLPFPIKQPIPAACEAKWPKKCQVVDCMWGSPVSRVVQAIPGGSCNWKSECATDADCAMAIDVELCCPCPAAYPKELVAKNVCLIKDWTQGYPPICKACMTGVPCTPCVPIPGKVPSCNPSGTPGINRCLPWPSQPW